MYKLIGIDLGTANSCVALTEGGEPCIIPSSVGAHITPSVVTIEKNGRCTIGQAAKRQALTKAERTVASFKRALGSSLRVDIDNTSYSPEEITAALLRQLKEDAEAYLGSPPAGAVIAVPNHFSSRQRQAVEEAAKIAGLNTTRIISSGSAAALSYAWRQDGDDERVMFCDLGSDSFEVSITVGGAGVVDVLSTAYGKRLGGDDFDTCITEYLAGEFKKAEGIELRGDAHAMHRLREAAEKAKNELSTMNVTEISIPYISGTKQLKYMLSREKFNLLTGHLVERFAQPVEQALSDAGLKAKDIDKLILVGGASRIPAVQEKLRALIGREAFRGINPDECVALGASVLAGILSGDVEGVLLVDVTTASLGVEVEDGKYSKIIERNTSIPTLKKQTFTTAVDNQTAIEVKVFEGESETAAENEFLGSFCIDGIPPADAGVPQFEISFDIDSDFKLTVTAKDLATGKVRQLCISQPETEKEKVKVDSKSAPNPPKIEAPITERDSKPPPGNKHGQQSTEYDALYGDIKADTLNKFLPVYDNLVRALAQPTEDEAYRKGVEMIMSQFNSTMEKLGVTEIKSLGEKFDPAFHNAVMHVEDEEKGENEIVEVFQKGFMLGDKVIRFAMVKVAN